MPGCSSRRYRDRRRYVDRSAGPTLRWRSCASLGSWSACSRCDVGHQRKRPLGLHEGNRDEIRCALREDLFDLRPHRRRVADDGHVGGPFGALAVEHGAIGRQLSVDHEGIRGPLTGLGLVAGHRHRQRDDDARRGPSGFVGRLCDVRDDVTADRLGAGHPGDRAVGEGSGERQHPRRQRRKQNRRRIGVDLELPHRLERLSHERDRLVTHQRQENRQVLAHVPGRLAEVVAPHVLDDDLMRQADAEREPSAARRLRRERPGYHLTGDSSHRDAPARDPEKQSRSLGGGLATRRSGGSRDSARALQESVDRLAGAFERMADRLEAIESGGGVAEGDRFTRHIRRYMPFYALATVWALMLFLLPTRPGSEQTEQAGQVTGGAISGGTFDSGAGEVAAGSGATAGAAGGARGAYEGVKTTVGPGGQVTTGFDPLAWKATGKTRGGFDCGPGIRQLPWSEYAVPCYPAWSGNNGGATSRGVTAKEIVVVERRFPESANQQAVDAVIQQAGFASRAERQATREEFIKYFNKTFELWGRQVKIIVYESEYGDSTEEALSKGKEGACADADSILAKYKPFVIVGTPGGGTSPFAECAAERKMMSLNAGAYYPERWYRKYHPYLWNGTMECERIAHQFAEYLGKRLANRPAKWAKRLEKNKPRVFGTWVPNNDQYQYCVRISEKDLKEKYGVNPEDGSRYNYPLDIQRWPDEAARAVVQFHADGVTTVVLASDPISPIFLTQSARGQEYFPEWITNGAGLTDVDQFARLWDQEEVQWSLFGMSQLGDVFRILSNEGEGSKTYKKATGTDIPPGAQVEYAATLGLFNVLQAAGPILTPQNVAAAIWRLPPGGAPHFEGGLVYYGTAPDGSSGHDHGGVDDHKEIYYLCTAFAGNTGGASRCAEPKAPDGQGGMNMATYGGKRFTNNTWPRGDPPVFPEY